MNDEKLWEEIESCLKYGNKCYNGEYPFLETTSIENLMDLFENKQTELLKKFVQFIKDSWAGEIKLWENQLEVYSAFSCERKAIEQKLISMRKMLGSLDSDLETFLETRIMILKGKIKEDK